MAQYAYDTINEQFSEISEKVAKDSMKTVVIEEKANSTQWPKEKLTVRKIPSERMVLLGLNSRRILCTPLVLGLKVLCPLNAPLYKVIIPCYAFKAIAMDSYVRSTIPSLPGLGRLVYSIQYHRPAQTRRTYNGRTDMAVHCNIAPKA
ncbi:hypothetical protein TSAR_016223 [Trichomalopsis sarcophagae]|uniref:Uncharacterized protein n=1 Tax=Trichomalopsis sarcophagae TaxID=543379 RepID=A0A232FJA0_9HYME|nr:hypothetical protein TSAR_016223 [Trichomalopsis sarcophagae]